MPQLVLPKVYIEGYTVLDLPGVQEYLTDTDNRDFLQDIVAAKAQGLSDGEILTSMYAKLCYASLTLGHNKNIEQTRDIKSNLLGTQAQGHNSVWQHAVVNFIISKCSRVFTHELVRHRVGTAFSQTSGRYVRSDLLEFVADPILQEHNVLTEDEQVMVLKYIEGLMLRMGGRIDNLKGDMTLKKKLTSAARRFLPNGQSNEIGFSINLCAIRHFVQVRSARGAEWEMRVVSNGVYNAMLDRYPLLFADAKTELIGGLLEVSGMKMQPYDRTA